MKSYNYEDLGITSAKKPFSTHLWWEHTTYGIVMVDSTNQAVLLHSTKARLLIDGSDWSVIDLSDNTNSYKIQSGWLDGNDLWLVMCDNDGTADDFEVCFIELDDSNDCNPVAVSAGADVNTVYAYDIFKIGSNIFVVNLEKRAASFLLVVWDVDTDPFVEKDTEASVGSVLVSHDWNMGIIVGDIYYTVFERVTKIDSPGAYQFNYKDSTTTIVVEDNISTHRLTTNINLRGTSYNGSDILYYILEQVEDDLVYLVSYSISGNSYIELGKHNIALMLDRNTASGVMEKAFHLTKYKVYQLHPHAKHQLYFISSVPTDAVLIGITDNFLMNDDGDVFEYVDVSNKTTRVEFVHEIQKASYGTLGVNRDKIIIEKGMFMQIEGKYTSAGSSSDEIIFEGIVIDFDGERLQKVWLESPAKKELERKPRGDFSGRSDEIMTSLVAAYCNYVTIGTLSSGTAMGTIKYAGDKTLQTIWNELALFEKWKWKLDPQGRLFFNDGTVDTLVDLSKTNKIWMVKTGKVREPYNYFYLKGAIVNGVQLVKELEEADDLFSQQQFGFNPFEKTYASFNVQGILDQLTANAKAKLKLTPLVVEHWHYDADLGMLAIMETVTFVYDTTNVNVSSDQFLINKVIFKAKQNAGGYTIADELV